MLAYKSRARITVSAAWGVAALHIESVAAWGPLVHTETTLEPSILSTIGLAPGL